MAIRNVAHDDEDTRSVGSGMMSRSLAADSETPLSPVQSKNEIEKLIKNITNSNNSPDDIALHIQKVSIVQFVFLKSTFCVDGGHLRGSDGQFLP